MMEFESCLFAEANQNLNNSPSSSEPAAVTAQVAAALLQTDTG